MSHVRSSSYNGNDQDRDIDLGPLNGGAYLVLNGSRNYNKVTAEGGYADVTVNNGDGGHDNFTEVAGHDVGYFSGGRGNYGFLTGDTIEGFHFGDGGGIAADAALSSDLWVIGDSASVTSRSLVGKLVASGDNGFYSMSGLFQDASVSGVGNTTLVDGGWLSGSFTGTFGTIGMFAEHTIEAGSWGNGTTAMLLAPEGIDWSSEGWGASLWAFAENGEVVLDHDGDYAEVFAGGRQVDLSAIGDGTSVRVSASDSAYATLSGDNALVRAGGGSLASVTLESGTNAEIDLSAETNVFSNWGAGSTFVTAAGRFNVLSGGLGRDFFIASGDESQIYGGGGNDTLVSLSSQSILNGGYGDNFLVGNPTGADRFQFNWDRFLGSGGWDFVSSYHPKQDSFEMILASGAIVDLTSAIESMFGSDLSQSFQFNGTIGTQKLTIDVMGLDASYHEGKG